MIHLTHVVVVALAVLLVACSGVPQEPPAPAAPLPQRFAQAEGLPSEAPRSEAPWWTGLGDPTLAALIERGLASNLDLQQAAERVQRSRALAAGSRAALGPSGGLRAGAQAAQASAHEAPGLSRADRRVDTLSLGVDLQWELDLFGRIRTQAGAAGERVRLTEAQAEGVRVAVAAEIAQAYFALLGAGEQLALARDTIANRRATVDLVQRRANAGFAAPIDDARARADLAAIESEGPGHDADAAVATHRLAVLLGVSPSGFTLPAVPSLDPAHVRVAVPDPARWLARRPDIAAAEADLRANALDVASVRAEFMPRLSITGLLGWVAGSATGLGAAASASWFAAPAVSVPLFDRPRIEARLAAAQAQQREALAAYRQSILLATEEVESALARYRQGQLRLAALHEGARQAGTAERLARARHAAGASDLLELLDAQRTAQQSHAALAQALTQQRQALIGVLRALGAAAPTGAKPGPAAAATAGTTAIPASPPMPPV